MILQQDGSQYVWLAQHHPLDRTETTDDATLIFLPPNSSDPTLVGHVFSELKARPRKENGRTVEHTLRRIIHLLDRFTAQECMHYFCHAG
jgi:transposase